MLGDEQPANRQLAAEALGKIGPEASAAAPALAALLEGDANDVPEAALKALAQIGPEAKTAVPALRKLLKGQLPTSLRAIRR